MKRNWSEIIRPLLLSFDLVLGGALIGAVVDGMFWNSRLKEERAYSDKSDETVVRCIAKLGIEEMRTEACIDELGQDRQCEENLKKCMGVQQ